MSIFVSNLSIYPLKSGKAMDVENIQVGLAGLAGDRVIMVVDEQGQSVTARKNYNLLKISTEITENKITFKAIGHVDCHILLNTLSMENEVGFYLWGNQINGHTIGTHADHWLSEVLQGEFKFVQQNKSQPRQHSVGGFQAFGDVAPFLLLSESSLEDVNTKLVSRINMNRFRPNIVLSGAEAYAEDGWQSIRIGDVKFNMSESCPRCVFTTINPETRRADLAGEPLKTLAQYRANQAGDIHFGQYMNALQAGDIRLGDRVEILETCQPPLHVVKLPQPMLRKNNSDRFILRCVDIIERSSGMKSFRFVADDMSEFTYSAGQFLTLHLAINGVNENRCYTMSSAPQDEYIEISVRLKHGGIASEYLHNELVIGDTIQASGAFGDFCLDQNEPQKYLFLSAGSGITPMVSMSKFLNNQQSHVEGAHLHFEKNRSAIAFHFELMRWAKASAGLRQYQVSLTDQLYPGCESGRLSKAQLLRLFGNISAYKIYLCGPSGFLHYAKNLLLEMGVDEAQIVQEKFEMQVKNTPIFEEIEHSVRFNGQHQAVKILSTQTILEIAQKNGIKIANSCLAGICGTCRCKLTKGEVFSSNILGLSQQDIDQNYILACSTFPTSNIEVDTL